MNGTLVTAYVDLNKYDDIDRIKKNEDYLPHIDNICQYNGYMIIHCEVDMVETIWKLRKKYNMLDKTYVSVFDFKELPLQSKLDEIKEHWSENRCPVGLNPTGKESPEFLIMMWSKLYFLQKSHELNPFKSSHFAWIDIGITYVPGILINNSTRDTLETIHKIMSEKPDKIRMPCICETSYSEFTSEDKLSGRRKFYEKRQCKLIMGFFVVPDEIIEKISSLFLNEVDTCISTGYPNTEDTIMTVVCVENRSLFDLYYGDYENIFSSYHRCRSRVSTLLLNLRHCNAITFHRGVSNIGAILLDSIDINEQIYNIDDIISMYNEILIGCWYLDDKRYISKDAATRMEKLLPMSTLPDNIKENFITNMKFHGISPNYSS